jgi:hypothetical protein
MMAALRDGMRRVRRAPAILAGVWLLTTAVGLPLAFVLRGMIAEQLGASLRAGEVAAGVDDDWMQEFAAQASGVGVTLKPTIVGFGAVLDGLSGFLDNVPRPLVITAVAGVYIVVWLFVAGGIIDRYARNRPTRAPGFFAVAGTFFFRFLRLGVLMLVVYAFLFNVVHRWMFGPLWSRLTHDLTVERTAFVIRLGLYAAFGLVFAACNLVFDYAKVRAVVEDRRSMIGAVAAALRFARTNLTSVAGLYLADFGLFLVVVAAYGLVAPGAGRGGMVWIAVAIGQLYILARLWVKLVFWASEVALFQSRLAHAGYVAAPEPVWPESAAAEALRS